MGIFNTITLRLPRVQKLLPPQPKLTLLPSAFTNIPDTHTHKKNQHNPTPQICLKIGIPSPRLEARPAEAVLRARPSSVGRLLSMLPREAVPSSVQRRSLVLETLPPNPASKASTSPKSTAAMTSSSPPPSARKSEPPSPTSGN